MDGTNLTDTRTNQQKQADRDRRDRWLIETTIHHCKQQQAAAARRRRTNHDQTKPAR